MSKIIEIKKKTDSETLLVATETEVNEVEYSLSGIIEHRKRLEDELIREETAFNYKKAKKQAALDELTSIITEAKKQGVKEESELAKDKT